MQNTEMQKISVDLASIAVVKKQLERTHDLLQQIFTSIETLPAAKKPFSQDEFNQQYPLISAMLSQRRRNHESPARNVSLKVFTAPTSPQPSPNLAARTRINKSSASLTTDTVTATSSSVTQLKLYGTPSLSQYARSSTSSVGSFSTAIVNNAADTLKRMHLDNEHTEKSSDPNE